MIVGSDVSFIIRIIQYKHVLNTFKNLKVIIETVITKIYQWSDSQFNLNLNIYISGVFKSLTILVNIMR